MLDASVLRDTSINNFILNHTESLEKSHSLCKPKRTRGHKDSSHTPVVFKSVVLKNESMLVKIVGHLGDEADYNLWSICLVLSHMFGYVEQKLLGRSRKSFFLNQIFSAVRNFKFRHMFCRNKKFCSVRSKNKIHHF
jgi:hypothetical protein